MAHGAEGGVRGEAEVEGKHGQLVQGGGGTAEDAHGEVELGGVSGKVKEEKGQTLR